MMKVTMMMMMMKVLITMMTTMVTFTIIIPAWEGFIQGQSRRKQNQRNCVGDDNNDGDDDDDGDNYIYNFDD